MGFDQIWAPWRMAYIKSQDAQPQTENSQPAILPGGDAECFLCQGVVDSADRARHVVARTEHALAVLNRYPYNNGHVLVAPRFHRARLDQLSQTEQLDVSQLLARMVCLLERVLRPEGFNIGLNLGRVAGAGLPGHLHWHIVPRWQGDTNFMPVVGATKVIPDSLDSLWEALTNALAKT